MQRIRFAVAVLVVLVLAGGSIRRLGPLPRLGPFLEPAHGAWGLLRASRYPRAANVVLRGLTGPVHVAVDDRGVPHIFASNELDAYRVQGFLTARERLFQLELTTRAAAGTLTELLGPGLLEADRESRQLALAWAADRKYASLDTASLGYRAIAAYADGVNAWIEAMGPGDLPLEYRLLDRQPIRWEPRFSLYLFAEMGRTLASEDPAEPHLAVQALVGEKAAQALVPLNSPVQQPIQPSSSREPRLALTPLPPPGPPDTLAARELAMRSDDRTIGRSDVGSDEQVTIGSNNWAVAPSRTASHHALLAGDPHLQLTLPSIWYEAHLVVPGQLDVAGVTLPGSPGVVIGFNRDVAWSLTNTGGDVLDWYAESVDDAKSPTKYKLDGAWRPLDLRVETYRERNGRVLAADTIRFTHRGPMRRVAGGWRSMRWTVHEPSGETDLFLRAARAKSADEWLEVMRGYVVPTQNALVADRAGTIGIRAAGLYPIRPGDGRGDRVFDGASAANDWTGALPVERYPQAIRPAQGYLVSANQQPIDPLDTKDYLGADWPPPWRAVHINALLRADSAMTPDAMRRMHTDAASAREETFRPWFVRAAKAELAAGRGGAPLEKALKLLQQWDGRYTPDNQRAILFELAMRELPRRLWDELIPQGEDQPVYRASPITLLALADSTSVWWDDRRTSGVVETRDGVVSAALVAALDSATAEYGDPDSGGWRWGRVWPTDIWHLLRIPALSAPGVAVQGGPETIAPGGRHGTAGPSWRMVVELGDTVRAWGTYPGGQSGNPASLWYANRIGQWARGDLDTILVPRLPDALLPGRVRSTFVFAPSAR